MFIHLDAGEQGRWNFINAVFAKCWWSFICHHRHSQMKVIFLTNLPTWLLLKMNNFYPFGEKECFVRIKFPLSVIFAIRKDLCLYTVGKIIVLIIFFIPSFNHCAYNFFYLLMRLGILNLLSLLSFIKFIIFKCTCNITCYLQIKVQVEIL